MKVLDIKDAPNADLHVSNPLKIPKATVGWPFKFVLPRLPLKTVLCIYGTEKRSKSKSKSFGPYPYLLFHFINILFYIIIDYVFGFSSALFDLSTCDKLKCILSAQKYDQVCHFKLKIKVHNQDLKNTYKEHL